MKRIIALTAVLILIVLCGCQGYESELVFEKTDTNIIAQQGQTFTIILEENPTTGYRWRIDIADDIVTLESDDYQQSKADNDMVGVGGQRILAFRSLEKGSTTIKMTYERSFEENSAIEVVVYQVTIE